MHIIRIWYTISYNIITLTKDAALIQYYLMATTTAAQLQCLMYSLKPNNHLLIAALANVI